VIEHFLREIIIDRRSSISILYGFYVKVFHLLVALVPSGEKCLSKRKMAGVAARMWERVTQMGYR
jgi:hypothetical protein